MKKIIIALLAVVACVTLHATEIRSYQMLNETIPAAGFVFKFIDPSPGYIMVDNVTYRSLSTNDNPRIEYIRPSVYTVAASNLTSGTNFVLTTDAVNLATIGGQTVEADDTLLFYNSSGSGDKRQVATVLAVLPFQTNGQLRVQSNGTRTLSAGDRVYVMKAEDRITHSIALATNASDPVVVNELRRQAVSFPGMPMMINFEAASNSTFTALIEYRW